jgi:hypothetical protein
MTVTEIICTCSACGDTRAQLATVVAEYEAQSEILATAQDEIARLRLALARLVTGQVQS